MKTLYLNHNGFFGFVHASCAERARCALLASQRNPSVRKSFKPPRARRVAS